MGGNPGKDQEEGREVRWGKDRGVLEVYYQASYIVDDA